MFLRLITQMACLATACIASTAALAQADRASAIAALRSVAASSDADAQMALAGLLDTDGTVRNDEALGLYEKAARSGNRLAQHLYLEMQSRPAPTAAAPLRAFTIRLPKSSLGEDDPQPDIPPGYHCHPLGNQTMWCHGGTDQP